MNLGDAMKLWKQHHDKPARPPFLVPTHDEIQAAYVLADRYLHDHDPKLKSVIRCEDCSVCSSDELDNADALIEAMKEGFAIRLADAEAKAEKCRLALERCKAMIENGVPCGSGRAALRIITDMLKGGA